MRSSVRTFAEEAARVLPIADPVAEIGSRPAEGQQAVADVRSFFAGHEFVGCDIQEGPGVDRVEDVHRLTFPDESVGTVVSFDTLEHVADPVRALQEIRRVLRPGGVVVVTSVMFFPIHAHPWDFWRFTPEGFGRLLDPFEAKVVLAHGWEHMPETVFGAAQKSPAGDLTAGCFPETARLCEQWGRHHAVDFGPIRMSTRQLWGYTLRATADAARRRVRAVRG